jgi:hypothetical protein
LHVDHDHITGRIRALLCMNCNNGLGAFTDDPDLMETAATYVRRYRAGDANVVVNLKPEGAA